MELTCWPWPCTGRFTSSDSGSNNAQAVDAGNPLFWEDCACSADGRKMVAVSFAQPNGVIATSTNYGTNWSTANNAPQNRYWNGVASCRRHQTGGGLLERAVSGGDAVYLVGLGRHPGGHRTTTRPPMIGTVSHPPPMGPGWWRCRGTDMFRSDLCFHEFGQELDGRGCAGLRLGGRDVLRGWRQDGRRRRHAPSLTGPISRAQTVVSPTLNIAPAGNRTAVSWTVPSTNFVLQLSTNLVAPNWVNVTNVPAFTNFQELVLVPATNRGGFFRLKTP